MTEHRLFEGPVPYVSTFDFHKDRERAPHLEQAWHQPRLHRAADFVRQVVERQPLGYRRVSDLGCGDGGLLSLIKDIPGIDAWGYDFAPANQLGWYERGVRAYARDVFDPVSPVNEGLSAPEFGNVVVMTEVLEHLADPHGALRTVRKPASWLVCSSPWNESPNNHCPEHAWAWDLDGYTAMIEAAGWRVVKHEPVDMFQVVLAH